MALNGSRKPKRSARGGLVAALDVGTTKVCCFVAEAGPGGSLRVIGIGHQVSQGLRAGAIIDMDAAALSIGNAVHAAEQMAEETVRDVIVSISGARLVSRTCSAGVGISGHEVGEGDLRRALGQSRSLHNGGEVELIHAIPVGYAIDGSRGIRDPRGMHGDRLDVQIHVVTAACGPARNLATCLARCHLGVESFVVSPYASGLACLVEDEMDLGVTLVDMGGGTTGIAVFAEGNVVHTDVIPVGGAHVTNDIARGLTTPVAHAERMKTLYGNAMSSVTDEREIIDVPQVGEDEPTQANHVPKSLLVGIIQPRLEEVFELVRSRLEASGFAKTTGRRVVLTGGACQLPGTRELAQLILDKQVRIGRPIRAQGLAEATAGPAFSTASGLLSYAVQHAADIPALAAEAEAPNGLIGRVGRWLRENI